MNIITVMAAQASLSYSSLMTALGLTGATFMGQVFVLAMLAVACILAGLAVAATLYYGAKGIIWSFTTLKNSLNPVDSDADVELNFGPELDDVPGSAPAPQTGLARASVGNKNERLPDAFGASSDNEEEERKAPSLDHNVEENVLSLTEQQKTEEFLEQVITDIENLNSQLNEGDKLDAQQCADARTKVKEQNINQESLQKYTEIAYEAFTTIVVALNSPSLESKMESKTEAPPSLSSPAVLFSASATARAAPEPSALTEENEKIAAYYEVLETTMNPKLFKNYKPKAEQKVRVLIYNATDNIVAFPRADFLKDYNIYLGRAKDKLPRAAQEEAAAGKASQSSVNSVAP